MSPPIVCASKSLMARWLGKDRPPTHTFSFMCHIFTFLTLPPQVWQPGLSDWMVSLRLHGSSVEAQGKMVLPKMHDYVQEAEVNERLFGGQLACAKLSLYKFALKLLFYSQLLNFRDGLWCATIISNTDVKINTHLWAASINRWQTLKAKKRNIVKNTLVQVHLNVCRMWILEDSIPN